MLFKLPSILIQQSNGAILVQHDIVTVLKLNTAQITVDHGGFQFGFDLRLLENLRGRSTNVERTHGELSARFTNRLGSDDTDSFPLLDQLAGCQIATVTLGA